METVLVIDGKVVRTLQRQYIGAAWKHLKIGVYEPILLQNYTNIRIFLNLKKLGNSFFFLILISSAHFFISCVKFLSDMR